VGQGQVNIMVGKQGQKWKHRWKEPSEFDKLLNDIEADDHQIRVLRKVHKTILAEGCWHDKNIEEQTTKQSKLGKITTEEQTFAEKIWKLRNLKSIALRKKFEAVIDEQLKEMKGVKKPKQTKKSFNDRETERIKEEMKNDISKL
jgi:hypothetical protein